MPSLDDSIRADLCRTGSLRAVSNLGNPVLVQGTLEAPTGVTVDIARELAACLDVDLELVPVTAARLAYEAARRGSCRPRLPRDRASTRGGRAVHDPLRPDRGGLRRP